MATDTENFLHLLCAAFRDGTFVQLTLGAYRGRDASIQQLKIRPVDLRGTAHYSFAWKHARSVITKNFPEDEALALLRDVIGKDFRSAHLFTTRQSVQLEFREGRQARLVEGPAVHGKPASRTHDREKRYVVNPREARWLGGLGVTDAGGKVLKGMEPKFRQINKFVEVLESLLQTLPAPRASQAEFRFVDMGCGKGYLTFAAYDCLRRRIGQAVRVRGIEARPELVELCNRVARENALDGLAFEAGTIQEAKLENIDVLVALHACDTATDDAIAKGIHAGASLIVVSPCCHKELRSQLKAPTVLKEALRHGILLEREAEFVTDALRAGLLEWAGYGTRVFEFISTEHTAKNLMIVAVKRHEVQGGPVAPAANVRALAIFYGIETQRLATRLGFELRGG